MSSIIGSTDLAGGGRALALVPTAPQPWYMTPPAVFDRQALEDEHTRILANAVGDHLPYCAPRPSPSSCSAARDRRRRVRSRMGRGRARARRRVR